MATTIDHFRGQYDFLSNFYVYDGNKSLEHYYQAAKASNVRDYLQIISAKSAAEAKRLGAKIQMRQEWNNIKLTIMIIHIMMYWNI
jgi:predicted NAD-dependent protein-ADP-ribosyltransferase YbiA (DUF1768 family)